MKLKEAILDQINTLAAGLLNEGRTIKVQNPANEQGRIMGTLALYKGTPHLADDSLAAFEEDGVLLPLGGLTASHLWSIYKDLLREASYRLSEDYDKCVEDGRLIEWAQDAAQLNEQMREAFRKTDKNVAVEYIMEALCKRQARPIRFKGQEIPLPFVRRIDKFLGQMNEEIQNITAIRVTSINQLKICIEVYCDLYSEDPDTMMFCSTLKMEIIPYDIRPQEPYTVIDDTSIFFLEEWLNALD